MSTIDDPEPIHTLFGLSYASYLVMPRSVLQSMPTEWQRKLTALVLELSERWDAPDSDIDYRVIAVDESLPEIPEHERPCPNLNYPIVRDPYEDYERGRRRVGLREPTP